MPKLPLPRRLAGVALLLSGAAAGAVLTPTTGIHAQDPTAAAIAALEKRIDKLEKQAEEIDMEDLEMNELEKRVDELAERIGRLGTELDPPEEDGLVVRAPFIVIGADGRPVMVVTGDSGATKVLVGDAGAGANLQLGVSGGKSSIVADSGSTLAKVEADGTNAFFSSTASGKDAALGQSEFGFGLFLNDGGQPAAEIAAPEGRGMALRVYQDGQNVAAVGAIPGEGGAVRVFAPGAPKAAAALNAGDGNGKVQVWDSGGEMVAVMDGKERSLTAFPQNGIVTIGKSQDKLGVFVNDKSGKPLAEIAQPGGAGMALRVFNNGRLVVAAGLPPGSDGGSVRVYGSSASQAAVSLETLADSSGRVHVYKPGGGEEAVLLDGKTGSVVVSGDAGSALLGNAQAASGTGLGALGGSSGGGWGLYLGDKGGRTLAEVAQPSGKGMALRIFDSGSQVAAVGAVPGQGGAVRIADSGGNAAATMTVEGGAGLIQAYKGGLPLLALAGKDSAVSVYNTGGISVASLGLSSNGSGGNLTTRDGSGFGVFSAGAASDGGGEACVNRVRGDGKQVNACLGLGLPSMGVGK
jgi:hypothetical protein